MQLDQLLAARADLWRGRATPQAAPAGLPSGFATLDAALCGHGWPRAGLSEVLTAHQGAGLALLLPLLAALGRQPRWLLWVDPPYLPFAPALAARGLDLRHILIVRGGADAAWVAEQGLRSASCAAVLAWTGPAAQAADGNRARRQSPGKAACWTPAALRRLQLAAADTDTPVLLLRPPAAAGETSPAALRLTVSARADGLEVSLLKQRGGRPGQRLQLPAIPDDAPNPIAGGAGASRGDELSTGAGMPPASTDVGQQVRRVRADAAFAGGRVSSPLPAPCEALQAEPPQPECVPSAVPAEPDAPPRAPPAARQVLAAGGGVLAAVAGRRVRRRHTLPRC